MGSVTAESRHAQHLGGGWGPQQSFTRGGSAPRSNALPFYIPFLTENVALFRVPFIEKWYPFHIPTYTASLFSALGMQFMAEGY